MHQHQPNPKRSALLIIDMQVGLFHGPEKPYDGERVLANINLLIHKARHAAAPIFAARHTGPKGSPIEPGSALSQLIPELAFNTEEDRVFDKTRSSCFCGTDLEKWLREAEVNELVVVGMKTQYCVDTACRIATELGFQVVLAADAHTCMDTQHLPARAIIDHHNMTLNGPLAKLMSTADIVF